MRQVMMAGTFYRLIGVGREYGRHIAKKLPNTVALFRRNGQIYRMMVDVQDVAEYMAIRERKRTRRRIA